MAHTFDIRFARSTGFAGLFEAPTNSFRWKGAGRLSIDAQGISIAVTRGLMSLFARGRSHRIAAEKLTEVYREGDALRLEFSNGEAPRTIVPFWARDRATAQQIVRLLPTQHTVELEHSTAATGSEYRFDWRVLTLLLIGTAGFGFGLLALQRYLTPANVMPASVPQAAGVQPLAHSSAPAEGVYGAEQSASVAQESRSSGGRSNATRGYAPSVVNPPAPYGSNNAVNENAASAAKTAESTRDTTGSRVNVQFHATATPDRPADAVAQLQFDIFMAELTSSGGSMDESYWWQVTVRIHNTPEFQGAEHFAQREMELAISRAWRSGDRELADSLSGQLWEIMSRRGPN